VHGFDTRTLERSGDVWVQTDQAYEVTSRTDKSVAVMQSSKSWVYCVVQLGFTCR
jgi:hypothetical protein